jgi:5S rRNA maturation endonuclease (ribonuclease M5)
MSIIKSLNFKEKLEKVHSLEEKIFNYYGVDIYNFYCPHCNDKRMKPFKSNQGDYHKIKCYGCNTNLDVLDIAKLMDSNLKNASAGAIVDYLLDIDYSNVAIASPIIETKKIKLQIDDYDEFIADALNKFNRAVVTNNSKELEYLYNRGYTHQDLESFKNLLGLDKDNNIVFVCSYYSYILRLLKPWHDKHNKEMRYKNSEKLKKTEHYCFLYEQVRENKIIESNYNLFIFEGVFDALTFKLVTKNKFLAFSTGGADSNHKLIADKINDIASRLNHKVNIFILFDNDETGEYNANLLADLFNKNYINVYSNMSKFLFKNSKDISDEFKNNREKLQERINCLINKIS